MINSATIAKPTIAQTITESFITASEILLVSVSKSNTHATVESPAESESGCRGNFQQVARTEHRGEAMGAGGGEPRTRGRDQHAAFAADVVRPHHSFGELGRPAPLLGAGADFADNRQAAGVCRHFQGPAGVLALKASGRVVTRNARGGVMFSRWP